MSGRGWIAFKRGGCIAASSVVLAFALLRFHHLKESGFRFADEGYHLLHAAVLDVGALSHTLYFKHGLIYFLDFGLKFFGFSPSGALRFSVVCGLLCVFFFFSLCRRFLSTASSLALASVFSCDYYIFYYQRSNMSDGYALLFFTLELLLLVVGLQAFGLVPGGAVVRGGRWRVAVAWSALILSGVLTGFSFTVRIQTCLTMMGVFGALGVAMLIECMRRRSRMRKFWSLFLLSIVWSVAGVVAYAVFMFAIKDDVGWSATLAWYGKNQRIAEASPTGWKPFLFQHLWRLCGAPFLFVSALGVFSNVRRLGRLGLVRLWLFVCFVGLLAAYLKMAMPWPRAYLYFVALLIFYWWEGMFFVYRNLMLGVRARRLVIAVVYVATVLGESALVAPFVGKTSGYAKVVDFMAVHGPGHYFATHTWPVFSLNRYKGKGFIIYPTYAKHSSSYRDWAITLKADCEEQGIRYLILDNNVSAFIPDSRVLQQFVVTYPPDAVYRNDFGDDYHTCMDAFGSIPQDDLFRDKVLVYDLARMNRLPREPVDYRDDRSMSALFDRVLSSKKERVGYGERKR